MQCMEMPHFQFTLRDMLWATFWAAVGVSAWTVSQPEELGPGLLPLWFAHVALRWIAPVAAVGVLFQWKLLILVWSVVVVSVLLLVLCFLLMHSIAIPPRESGARKQTGHPSECPAC